jgi:hypothetical protein
VELLRETGLDCDEGRKSLRETKQVYRTLAQARCSEQAAQQQKEIAIHKIGVGQADHLSRPESRHKDHRADDSLQKIRGQLRRNTRVSLWP